MASDLNCAVCTEPFDLESRRPKIGSCFHTSCSKCFSNREAREGAAVAAEITQCPFCNLKLVVGSPSTVPDDTVTLKLLRSHLLQSGEGR
jgi:hypothetical protein